MPPYLLGVFRFEKLIKSRSPIPLEGIVWHSIVVARITLPRAPCYAYFYTACSIGALSQFLKQCALFCFQTWHAFIDCAMCSLWDKKSLLSGGFNIWTQVSDRFIFLDLSQSRSGNPEIPFWNFRVANELWTLEFCYSYNISVPERHAY